MKLARFSVAPAILFGLCLGLAGGCGSKKPPGTNPPGEDGGGKKPGKNRQPKGDGGASDGGAVTDAGDGGDDGGAPTTCDAKVADAPTLIFSDLVMFRPPIGVEFPPDDNPMVQTAQMSGGFMSACDAMIKRVMVFVYQMDKKKKPAKLMEEFIKTLESQGYTGGTQAAANVDTATDYHVAVEYGGGGGSQATALYLAVARRGDKDFILVYESSPEELELLKPTYAESAKSLLLVPQ